VSRFSRSVSKNPNHHIRCIKKKLPFQPFQTKTNNTSEHTPTTTPKEYKHQNHNIIRRKNDTQKSQQHKHKQQQELPQPQQHHGRTTK
jgi:hypothetical protein